MIWDKYGSPYDANHRGKMRSPQDRREQERREQKSHQVRGCGNPDCTLCNPETAGHGLGAGPVQSFSAPGFSPGYRDVDMRAAMERTLREAGMSNIPVFTVEVSVDRTTQKSAAPPASYEKARKEVEKWLIAAPDQAFDDIVGNTDALAGLRDAIEAPVKHKALYDAYGMKMPKGALLSGPPGCGKTMFARAAASEMKRLYAADGKFEFISISGSELQSPFVGVTEGYIKAIFTFAREYAKHHGHPLLVFMDEADVLLPDRTGRVRRVASWEESQVATFLAEMDGMQESGAFVLLATNRPEVIDQAVLRDGRCDFKIVVKRPTAEAIEIILRKNFATTLLGADTLDQLVMAACESLFDPFRIIADFHTIKARLSQSGIDIGDAGHRHFLLEHIISGAMAASIPARAKRHAFARDKADGVPRGVTVADVLHAVNDLFEENRTLDHSFALNEFKAEFEAEMRTKTTTTSSPPPPEKAVHPPDGHRPGTDR